MAGIESDFSVPGPFIGPVRRGKCCAGFEPLLNLYGAIAAIPPLAKATGTFPGLTVEGAKLGKVIVGALGVKAPIPAGVAVGGVSL